MSTRKVLITRFENVGDRKTLPAHPNIRNLWEMPWGYVLFEFYDPVFELVDSPGSSPVEFANLVKSLRPKLADLANEERRLLSPLYSGRP
jgi:hypothetical protein